MIGGNGGKQKTEQIDVSPGNHDLPKLSDYPTNVTAAVCASVAGAVWSCGGHASSLCYRYHWANDSWTQPLSLLSERWYAASVMVTDSVWWITGGDRAKATSSTEILTFGGPDGMPSGSKGPPLPVAYTRHCVVKVDENRFFLSGGYTREVLVLNWNTTEWIRGTEMSKVR